MKGQAGCKGELEDVMGMHTARKFLSAPAGRNRTGKIPSPTSSSVVDPEGPSENTCSLLSYRPQHICTEDFTDAVSATDVRQLMSVCLR